MRESWVSPVAPVPDMVIVGALSLPVAIRYHQPWELVPFWVNPFDPSKAVQPLGVLGVRLLVPPNVCTCRTSKSPA